MKKVLSLGLAAMMLMGALAGCGGQGGTGSYTDLSMIEGVELGVEQYGVAFRKGSDMVAKVDAISAELFKDGTIAELAEKYDQKDSIVTEFKASTDSNPTGDSDWEYIKNKGKLIVGCTIFDPMNYKDDNGNWVGFDVEYAQAVCKKLGIEAEFKVIEWDTKEMALETKAIDCAWNGMTLTDAMLNAADCTGAYMRNFQVVVVKDAKTFTSLESLKGKTVAVEAGSAGEAAAKANDNLSGKLTPVEDQAAALLQVKSGAADACVIDYVMAKAMLQKK